MSVDLCVLEEQPQPWGALQHSKHCPSPKALLSFQWVFLTLVFGGCKTHFHIQEGAEGQRCSGALCVSVSADGDVDWSSLEAASGDGNLNFQQYCSTGQNYILMAD